MRPPLRILAAVLLITVSAPAFADKVTEAIASGRQYYQDQRLSKAIRELRYAIAQISRRLSAAYQATMPPAPVGWKMQKARRRGGAGIGLFAAGTIITRNYRQQDGRGRITVQLAVDNPMMQAFAMMFANPQMAAASGFERIRVRGVRTDALIKYNPETKRGEAILLLAGRVFIKIGGQRIENDAILRDLLQSWNYEDLKKVAEIR